MLHHGWKALCKRSADVVLKVLGMAGVLGMSAGLASCDSSTAYGPPSGVDAAYGPPPAYDMAPSGIDAAYGPLPVYDMASSDGLSILYGPPPAQDASN